jgi:chitin disaccharide deacetylase
MLIVNADDWGRSVVETDVALRCYKAGRVTSVSAMVFMEDSERAADLAKQNGVDTGLHLNFDESFTANGRSRVLGEYQTKLASFLRRNKYAQLVYNPFLRQAFSYSYQAQAEEFVRSFGKPPSHIDGHHHMHLCANLLLNNLIPAGMRVRRNFSFWPGEKSLLNRVYRGLVDRWLARRYRLPDYFFDLTQSLEERKLDRVLALAKSSNVELMTHPAIQREAEYLLGDEFCGMLQRLELGGYVRV